MRAVERFEPSFVEEVPDKLVPGIFYVSLEHATMLHLCACGCGHEVVLPLDPDDWRFTYDGRTISVAPSVGSWSLPCRSHYVIRRGRVDWATDWSQEKIYANRRQDRLRKGFGQVSKPVLHDADCLDTPRDVDQQNVQVERVGLWARLTAWLRS